MRILRARLLAAGRRRGRRGGLRRPAPPGAHRRPVRADPHLQLPGEPDQRPPRRLQGLQPRPGARRRPRRASCRPCVDADLAARLAAMAERVTALARASAARRPPTAGRGRACRAPAHDAEVLAAHVLGVSPGPDVALADLASTRPARCVRRRCVGRACRARAAAAPRPGGRTSATSTLAVGPGVFVPRPETEVVVEAGDRDALRRPTPRTPARRRPVHRLRGDRAASVATEVPGARRARGRADGGRATPGPTRNLAGRSRRRPARSATRPTAFPEPRRRRSTSWSATRPTSRTAP